MSDDVRLGFRPHLDGFYDASLQLQTHTYRRSESWFRAWHDRNDALHTVDDVRVRQEEIRRNALAALGGLPDEGTPLDAEYVGVVEGEGFQINKVIYQSLPGAYVTANLYLPRDLQGPAGAVLFVCGHAELAKSYPHYQAVCARLARNGLVVLAIDPIGQGERKSYLDANGEELVRWGTREHTYAGVQCWWLGQSIARYFVHDARRAIDLLCTRPEVNPNRIGITGNSGGGTQATWMMMVEPRLAAAAPGTFIMARQPYMWTGQAQDAEQIVLGGTLHGIDHEDFLIAMAPRPVIVLSVESDFFPLEAAAETVERTKRIYRLFGREADVSHVHTPGTHEYHPELAKAATSFFVRSLLHRDPSAVDHTEPATFDPAALNCTQRGQIVLDRPGTRRVFDLNLAEFQRHVDSDLAHRMLGPTELLRFEPLERRVEATGAHGLLEQKRRWIADRAFHHRKPGPFHPRLLPGPDLSKQYGDDAPRIAHSFWWSERDMLNAGVLVTPRRGNATALTIALFDQGSTDLETMVWRAWTMDKVSAGEAVLALDVRGTGALLPHAVNPAALDDDYGTIYKLLCDLLWLDDSLEAARIFDVLRAVQLVRSGELSLIGDVPIHLLGVGRGGFHAYYAAAIDARITRVEVVSSELDPRATVTKRIYGMNTGWQHMIPGMAIDCTFDDLRPLFEGRDVIAG